MQSGTSNRGFASMDREKQKEIARKGGRAAHERGTAHEFTPDEARAAGRKGGERVSANRDHMSRIGRMGGMHSAGRRQSTAAKAAPVMPEALNEESAGSVTLEHGAAGQTH
jgi:hypothetical protein